ncbi:MAG: VWA domain-containing protein [Deltaproteobacteria bacterium]|nr:VWA domain-containing protein [Deltaproteobacteria bacterium]
MRKLLLGLLPIACTISSADTKPEQRIAAPNNQPIIEKGQGCGPAGQDIATDGGGGTSVRDRRAPRSVKGGEAGEADDADYERAPMKKPAPGRVATDRAPPPPPAVAPSSTTPSPVTGGRGGAPSPAKIATARPPMEQPSGVRAGEWDDNANYRDYVKWLANSSTRPRIDVTGRQFLVVTDTAGKPMPNVPITITSSGTSAKLTTMASGRAILFPTAFGLSGDLTATATFNGATATAKLSAKTVDGVIKLQLPTTRVLPAKRIVDLAFVLDTTGSMSEEIDAVKQTIKAVSDQLSTAQTDVRIGLVEYKDRSDCLLTRTFPFSSDLRAFGASVANVSASGGGDMPEDLHKGLDAALDKLQWRSDAATRMVVVIADAPPQFYAQSNDYTNAAKRASARGIKLYTVAASGMDNLGQVVMRQMSQFTGASNMFVLRGGAGPQSTGGGDPTSSCGGTHQDFSSGKLDQLIMRKVRQELASIDADPMKIPGRGQDENAKPCEQRLVLAN